MASLKDLATSLHESLGESQASLDRNSCQEGSTPQGNDREPEAAEQPSTGVAGSARAELSTQQEGLPAGQTGALRRRQ